MKWYTIIAILSLSFSLSAQKQWSLAECINYAIEHNLTIDNAELGIQNAEIGAKLAKQSRLPSLNFNTNAGFNIGRSIDPVSNLFVTATNSFNSLNLNSGVRLFNFGAINKSIASEKHNVLSAEFNRKQTEQDIALLVTTAYLDVLFNKANLENAQNTLAISKAQLDQISKLVDAGSRPYNERLDVEAQIANDQQNIIGFENQITLALLRLRQAMLLPQNEELDIIVPDLNMLEELAVLDADAIYQKALQSQHSVKAIEHAILSAKFNEEAVSKQKLPSIDGFAGINSNFSSQLKEGVGSEIIQTPGQEVLINNEPALLSTFQEVPTGVRTQSYGTQLDDNLGGNVGIQISVPIFNRFANKAAEQRAHVNTLTQELTLQQEYQAIRNDVESAVANARAAQKQLLAADRAVEAQEAAYENARVRYDLGAGNSFDLTNAQNRLDNARNNYNQAKYDYIFRLKIIDFYLGNPLTLN